MPSHAPRLDFASAAPDLVKALVALDAAIARTGLPTTLLDLVRLRASQVNGCAFCVDLHAADLRRHGESERRLAALPVWRETPFFDDRERAALAWTEALTRVADARAPDADHAALAAAFSPAEQVALTLAIGTINTWNRLAIAFRKLPA